jgi:hypothetical protein
MKSELKSTGDASAEASVTANDVVFDCPQCGKSMVVDRAAEGMILECASCHSSITVPSKGEDELARQELIKENLRLRAHLESLEKQQQEFRAKFSTPAQGMGARTPLNSAAPSGDVSDLRGEIAAMRSVLAGVVDKQRDDYLSLIRTGLEEARESRRQTDEMLRLVVEMAARNGRSVRVEDVERDSNGRGEGRKPSVTLPDIERLKGELRDARADLFRLTTASGWGSSSSSSSKPPASVVKPPAVAASAPVASAVTSPAPAVVPSAVGNVTAIAEPEPSVEPAKGRKRRRRVRAYIGMLLPCLVFVGVLGIVWRVFVSKSQASAPAPSLPVAVQPAAKSESLAAKPSSKENEAESTEKLALKQALQLAQEAKLAEAITAVREILDKNASSTEARHWLAALLAEQGQHQDAIREYRQVLQEDPKHIGTLNNLAYLLATDPDESLRNGKEAVTLASRAWELSSQRNPSILDTLAAAYAESGQFPQAVTAAKSAVAMALSDRNNQVADQIKSRLQWYEMGIPYRDNTQRAIRKAGEPEASG